ncbi:MAG: hypothetical protein VKJ64_13210 [Leptolyngbyaceae bacterium]|nr:hypothetical protein [Leptolyngbyaceae bacterium]
MQQSIGLMGKVMGLSLAISLAIKYLAPFLPIPATDGTALTLVLLPTIVMAGLLGWRWRLANRTN